MSGGERLPVGVYEQLVSDALDLRLRANGTELDVVQGLVDAAEAPRALGAYIGELTTRALQSVAPAERSGVVNGLVAQLAAATRWAAETDRLVDGPRELLSISDPAILGPDRTRRPQTRLSRSDLFINARGEPALHEELAAEMASADSVDLLCAFVKWQGLRLLLDPIGELLREGHPLRVITTTYVGATERRALDELVRLGAQVKVSYETRTTRLHAKAWLFRRESGFASGYVGSSNLSRSALVDGLEWNVRLAAGDTSALLDKFATSFESYWADPSFETYDPGRDADRLDTALGAARGQQPVTLSGLEVRAWAYQQEILDRLDAERKVHDRWRNLIVAATGTGKTVIAALDYRRLREELGELSLLFVAHRREILDQSRLVFGNVLADGSFGESLHQGQVPQRWQHVFASVQSLTAQTLERMAPDQFDVVIIDEFHHAEAATYRRILDRLDPRVLLGLTATPERADGADITQWFGGHVAAELRLWHALEQDLLCPFHYFVAADSTDLSRIGWRRGGYDMEGLSNLYTGNDARTRIVLRELREKVTDPASMRALGFCVSVAHAHYMARVFTEAGIPSVAVDGGTDAGSRADALHALRDRRVNVVFARDLFNEGLDVPQVDTVLFLRPTESPTVFLQQLGRGLRRAPGKACLTVLDFVGQADRRFRWDMRLRALTGASRSSLVRHVEAGFPYLPAGSAIHLDRRARELVLDNLKAQLPLRRPQLVAEIREYGDLSLEAYLARSGREPVEIYARKASWSALRREAGFEVAEPGPGEDALLRRVFRLLRVDDQERLTVWQSALAAAAPPSVEQRGTREHRLMKMLYFTLWPDGGGFPDHDAGFAHLWRHPAVVDEMRQLLHLAAERIRHVPVRLTGFEDVPLWIHSRYSREELLAAVGRASMTRTPTSDQQGVRFAEEEHADVLTFTVAKSERDYSPTTMYRDYAITPDLLHWESQSTTSTASPTGQRYLHHQERGTHVLLFARETNDDELGARPYLFLGPARYVSHQGSRPIAITWRLDVPMPADFFQASSVIAR